MVKLCVGKYPANSEEKYKSHFEKYSFELSHFQKYAIESIVEGCHSLVCAPTGSGKTLVADFALEYFVSLGKKVIYTSPIKALSNQKFNEFSIKYPHISFGILTGDIKTNPEADVLIMTSEILLNQLYSSTVSNKSTHFTMDIENELGCVVMDEVHYINDPERGHVWEETIMLLPNTVQMIMLSATLDSPEKFARWCESQKGGTKTVYLSCETHRNVPLTHYSFITCNSSIFKIIKDKSKQEEIKSLINKPFIIQSATGEYNEPHYFKMNNMLKLFSTKNVVVKRQHVLNNVTKYMVENEMLPALCFVLSRKAIEICAQEVTTVLLEDDSKVPYIVREECSQILRKLPNFKEYLELPEYLKMVSLLEKGIAIHHAGVMPVLREMVELLYSKGYIKLLFATETFSIGLNMPTKSVIFMDAFKYDGSTNRILHSHEYTQMAGRAGRRGIDKIGSVIHLNNLFRNMDSTSYRIMMKGTPQILTSKFKISYNLVLNLQNNENVNSLQFIKKSMIQTDAECQIRQLNTVCDTLNSEIDKICDVFDILSTPYKVIDEYLQLNEKITKLVNKKKKECEKSIQNILGEYKNIERDKLVFLKYMEKIQKRDLILDEIIELEETMANQYTTVKCILISTGFLSVITDDVNRLNLKGVIASNINEVHCLCFSELITEEILTELNTIQLITVLSCFTNVNVCDDLKCFAPWGDDPHTIETIKKISELLNTYSDLEASRKIVTGSDYNIHYDLIDYIFKWCSCQNIEDCKIVIQLLQLEKDIELGDFIKALLKINNICSEFQKIGELTGNIKFLEVLRDVPKLTLKYVATNQSLYI